MRSLDGRPELLHDLALGRPAGVVPTDVLLHLRLPVPGLRLDDDRDHLRVSVLRPARERVDLGRSRVVRDADEAQPLGRRDVHLVVRAQRDELPRHVEELVVVDGQPEQQAVGTAVVLDRLGDRIGEDRAREKLPEEPHVLPRVDLPPLRPVEERVGDPLGEARHLDRLLAVDPDRPRRPVAVDDHVHGDGPGRRLPERAPAVRAEEVLPAPRGERRVLDVRADGLEQLRRARDGDRAAAHRDVPVPRVLDERDDRAGDRAEDRAAAQPLGDVGLAGVEDEQRVVALPVAVVQQLLEPLDAREVALRPADRVVLDVVVEVDVDDGRRLLRLSGEPRHLDEREVDVVAGLERDHRARPARAVVGLDRHLGADGPLHDVRAGEHVALVDEDARSACAAGRRQLRRALLQELPQVPQPVRRVRHGVSCRSGATTRARP